MKVPNSTSLRINCKEFVEYFVDGGRALVALHRVSSWHGRRLSQRHSHCQMYAVRLIC